MKLQRHTIARGEPMLVILQARDASGKDGAAKQHLEAGRLAA